MLSGALVVGDGLPSIDYLHLGQHANVFTVIDAPIGGWLGMWALPLLQVSACSLPQVWCCGNWLTPVPRPWLNGSPLPTSSVVL